MQELITKLWIFEGGNNVDGIWFCPDNLSCRWICECAKYNLSGNWDISCEL